MSQGKEAAGLMVFDEKNETTNVLQQHVSQSAQANATTTTPDKIQSIEKVILFLASDVILPLPKNAFCLEPNNMD